MPFCPRAAVSVLASVSFTACSPFETQENEFPDAGPHGADSLYAGIGQGIPFGAFGLRPEQFRSPHTGAIIQVSRSTVGSALKAAQAGKLRLALNLAGGGKNFRNADGTFSLELWKSRIDTYRDVDFSPYVTEGLVLAHYLMDEPGAMKTWGGQRVSQADIEEMARLCGRRQDGSGPAIRPIRAWTSLGPNGKGRTMARAPGSLRSSSATKTSPSQRSWGSG